MRAFLHSCKTQDWLNDTAAKVVSGQLVVLPNIVGFASADIEIGSRGTLELEGVFRSVKLATAVIKAGELLAWRPSIKAWVPNSAATTGDIVGAAIAEDNWGNGQTEVHVNLCCRFVNVK